MAATPKAIIWREGKEAFFELCALLAIKKSVLLNVDAVDEKGVNYKQKLRKAAEKLVAQLEKDHKFTKEQHDDVQGLLKQLAQPDVTASALIALMDLLVDKGRKHYFGTKDQFGKYSYSRVGAPNSPFDFDVLVTALFENWKKDNDAASVAKPQQVSEVAKRIGKPQQAKEADCVWGNVDRGNINYGIARESKFERLLGIKGRLLQIEVVNGSRIVKNGIEGKGKEEAKGIPVSTGKSKAAVPQQLLQIKEMIDKEQTLKLQVALNRDPMLIFQKFPLGKDSYDITLLQYADRVNPQGRIVGMLFKKREERLKLQAEIEKDNPGPIVEVVRKNPKFAYVKLLFNSETGQAETLLEYAVRLNQVNVIAALNALEDKTKIHSQTIADPKLLEKLKVQISRLGLSESSCNALKLTVDDLYSKVKADAGAQEADKCAHFFLSLFMYCESKQKGTKGADNQLFALITQKSLAEGAVQKTNMLNSSNTPGRERERSAVEFLQDLSKPSLIDLGRGKIYVNANGKYAVFEPSRHDSVCSDDLNFQDYNDAHWSAGFSKLEDGQRALAWQRALENPEHREDVREAVLTSGKFIDASKSVSEKLPSRVLFWDKTEQFMQIIQQPPENVTREVEVAKYLRRIGQLPLRQEGAEVVQKLDEALGAQVEKLAADASAVDSGDVDALQQRVEALQKRVDAVKVQLGSGSVEGVVLFLIDELMNSPDVNHFEKTLIQLEKYFDVDSAAPVSAEGSSSPVLGGISSVLSASSSSDSSSHSGTKVEVVGVDDRTLVFPVLSQPSVSLNSQITPVLPEPTALVLKPVGTVPLGDGKSSSAGEGEIKSESLLVHGFVAPAHKPNQAPGTSSLNGPSSIAKGDPDSDANAGSDTSIELGHFEESTFDLHPAPEGNAAGQPKPPVKDPLSPLPGNASDKKEGKSGGDLQGKVKPSFGVETRQNSRIQGEKSDEKVDPNFEDKEEEREKAQKEERERILKQEREKSEKRRGKVEPVPVPASTQLDPTPNGQGSPIIPSRRLSLDNNPLQSSVAPADHNDAGILFSRDALLKGRNDPQNRDTGIGGPGDEEGGDANPLAKRKGKPRTSGDDSPLPSPPLTPRPIDTPNLDGGEIPLTTGMNPAVIITPLDNAALIPSSAPSAPAAFETHEGRSSLSYALEAMRNHLAKPNGYEHISLPELIQCRKQLRQIRDNPELKIGPQTLWRTLNPENGEFKAVDLLSASEGGKGILDEAIRKHTEEYLPQFRAKLSAVGVKYEPQGEKYYFQRTADDRIVLKLRKGNTLNTEELRRAFRELAVICEDMRDAAGSHNTLKRDIRIHESSFTRQPEKQKEIAIIVKRLGLELAPEKAEEVVSEDFESAEDLAQSDSESEERRSQKTKNTVHVIVRTWSKKMDVSDSDAPVTKAVNAFDLDVIVLKQYKVMNKAGCYLPPLKKSDPDCVEYVEKTAAWEAEGDWDYLNALDITRVALPAAAKVKNDEEASKSEYFQERVQVQVKPLLIDSDVAKVLEEETEKTLTIRREAGQRRYAVEKEREESQRSESQRKQSQQTSTFESDDSDFESSDLSQEYVGQPLQERRARPPLVAVEPRHAPSEEPKVILNEPRGRPAIDRKAVPSSHSASFSGREDLSDYDLNSGIKASYSSLSRENAARAYTIDGCIFQPVTGNGDCFYTAVAHQLTLIDREQWPIQLQNYLPREFHSDYQTNWQEYSNLLRVFVFAEHPEHGQGDYFDTESHMQTFLEKTGLVVAIITEHEVDEELRRRAREAEAAPGGFNGYYLDRGTLTRVERFDGEQSLKEKAEGKCIVRLTHNQNLQHFDSVVRHDNFLTGALRDAWSSEVQPSASVSHDPKGESSYSWRRKDHFSVFSHPSERSTDSNPNASKKRGTAVTLTAGDDSDELPLVVKH